MKTIKYKFVDGTVSEIEVSDEFFTVHEQMEKTDKRNHWKNTRRHDPIDDMDGLCAKSITAMDLLTLYIDKERSHLIRPHLSHTPNALHRKPP